MGGPIFDISNYQLPQTMNFAILSKACDGLIFNCEMTAQNVQTCVAGAIKNKIPAGFYYNFDRTAGIDFHGRGLFMGGLSSDLEKKGGPRLANWFAVDSYAAAQNFGRAFKAFKAGYEASGAKTALGIYCGLYNFERFKIYDQFTGLLWLAYYNGARTRSKYNEDLRQYTDSAMVRGINAKVDANICFNSRIFMQPNVATPAAVLNPVSVSQLALKVLEGVYGNGEARRRNLGENYDQVQNFVNKSINLAKEAVKGLHGNGGERVKKLGEFYECVQFLINNKMI